MTDVEFKSSEMELSLNFLGMDDHDPNSIKLFVEVKLNHHNGFFSYSADDIWLSTQMWDDFVLNLGSSDRKSALFKDQSEYFCLKIEQVGEDLFLIVSIREPLVHKGNLTLLAEVKLDLDVSFKSRLQQSFRDFPVFW